MSRRSIRPSRPRGLRAALGVSAIAALAALWEPSSATAAIAVSEAQEIVASDATAGMYFGGNVALDGDLLVSAAPYSAESAPGAAYVYRRSGGTWAEEATLNAGADAFTAQRFAGSWASTVAVAGDTIVVGAAGEDEHGTLSGAAYVFTHDGSAWSSTPQKLTAPDAAAYAHFGMHVSISADESTVLVGAPFGGAADPGKVYVYERSGGSYAHAQTLTPPDGANFDQFGIRAYMAQDTNTIVVSSWYDDNAIGSDAGALYVYEPNGTTGDWEHTDKLLISDGQAGWLLGWALAISPDGDTIAASTAAGLEGGVFVFERAGEGWMDRGALPHPVDTGAWLMGDSMAMSNDTLVIGHSASDQEVGAGHVYRRSGATWTYAHRLVPSDGDQGDYGASPSDPDAWGDWAGISVSVSGSTIAIGSPNHDDGGQQAGAVYLFEDPVYGQSGIDMTEQQEIGPSDAEVAGSFGNNLAMDGAVMVVGAPDAGIGSASAGTGAAMVYRLSNGSWSEEAALTANDGSVGQGFASPWARTVAVAGDTIVVGASQDDDEGTDSGAAYVFTYDGSAWSTTPQKLTATDLSDYDRFGMHVSISADESTILVGAPFSGAGNVGKVYVFERDGASYVWQDTLTDPESGTDDEFGIQAGIAQDTIVVSSWNNDNANGADAGALYVFERNGTTGDWEYDEKLVIADGQAGWRLGWGLAISPDANTIATSTAADLEGGVYVFERTGGDWTELGELPHPADTGDWLMGDSIVLSNDALVIGHSAMLEEIGGAYIFRHDGTGWSLSRRLVPSDGGPGDYRTSPNDSDAWGDWAGTSVALSGANVAIGAPNHDDGGAQAGSVYVYRDPGPAADGDVDGLSDDLEAAFNGPDPGDSLAIRNAETGDVAYAEGTVEEGVTLYSGSYAIELPPNTSVLDGAAQLEITMVSGAQPRVAVSGADLAGGTKSITIPFDPTAGNPVVCIDDSATATVDSVLDGGCSGVTVAIPSTVGASNTVGAFTVTRLLDARARVAGLRHTALASFDLEDAPPVVELIDADAEPVTIDASVSASATFSDADDGGAHLAEWSWGDGTTSTGSVDQSANEVTGSHDYAEPGVYSVSITITDANGAGASAAAVFQYVVVYDPDGGFVTGGGWIDSPAGAYPAQPSLTGKATFGFVAKYKRGRSVPEGSTEFQFKAADLNFKAQGDFEWLAVSGSGHKATFRGTGTINGTGSYGVTVTVIDEANTPSTDVDLFRIKIVSTGGGGLVYDNQLGTSCGTGDDNDPCTAIGGGNIKIHKD